VNAFVQFQRLLPQHALSRVVGRFATSTLLARPLIGAFSAAYRVDLADAQRKTHRDYSTFNDFFTRELADGARPLPDDPRALVSPVDGTVSQLGTIDDGALLQAKGVAYLLASLLLDSRAARIFNGGWFATIYLAPSNYHRVHVPFDGTLVRSVAVPGQLFSVNARTEAGVERLFCVNERLVMHFKTAAGPLVLVMVGALIVASIETVFEAPQSPYKREVVSAHDRQFVRGEEVGRFLLGSTAIVVLPRDVFKPSKQIRIGTPVRMGEALGTINPITTV
jgi:phosphatidylserine decarboxylase